MTTYPIHYATLRYQHEWDSVNLTGLEQQPGGALALARVPAPADGIPVLLPGPFAADLSGVVITPDRFLCSSNPQENRLTLMDERCGENVVLQTKNASNGFPWQLQAPRGLLVGTHQRLYVADSESAQVQILRLPSLELRAIWENYFQQPTGLASDSKQRVYVLDRGLQRILRFDAAGAPDIAYNTAMSQHPELTSPFSLAIDEQDVLYVSDDLANSVLRFDDSGALLPAIAPTAAGLPAQPRTLTAWGSRAFAADAAAGGIWVFDCDSVAFLGTVANFAGPVSAMTIDQASGDLLVKPDAGETIDRFQNNGAYIPSGLLATTQLDAGQDCQWESVHVVADVPASASVNLQTFTTNDPARVPTAGDWTPQPTLDCLLLPFSGTCNDVPVPKRFLWLQVQTGTADASATPVLHQVVASTIAESYLEHLPAIYRKEDLPARFLERWLALFRSELGGLELKLDDMPRLCNPATTPMDFLPWLASWLAFDLPKRLSVSQQRDLLLKVQELYERRGTPLGLREFVELNLGAKVHLFEAFRERRVWQLGISSTLGFNTALAANAPDGMIVAGVAPPDPRYFGVQGNYYDGANFDVLKATHAVGQPTPPDGVVNFEWGNSAPDPAIDPSLFSIQWTGQIQARYAEKITFHVASNDVVRLRVNDELILDSTAHAPVQGNEYTGTMAMTLGRWYKLELEFSRKASVSTGDAVVQLSWSSRSQAKEIVPQSQLYSILDDTADLTVPPQSPGCGTLLVGQTVVGESGPLQASQFGTPLFSDTAHLFTVSLPAARLHGAADRQELRQLIEAEKPAHTDFHLCFVEARMRVGFQSRVGIDAIVGGPPKPMSMVGTVLGLDSFLGSEVEEDELGRIGKRSRIGQNTLLG
jgi:phage tail-like protein